MWAALVVGERTAQLWVLWPGPARLPSGPLLTVPARLDLVGVGAWGLPSLGLCCLELGVVRSPVEGPGRRWLGVGWGRP